VSAPLQRFMKQHPLNEDEGSLLVRWFLDRDDYQTPTARVVAITGRLSQLVLSGKQLAYSFCVFRKPDDWVSLWKDIDLPWQLVTRFTLGPHEYSLIAFMWKRRSLRDVLLQAWQEPQADETSRARLSFDELRSKVGERVAGLAQKLKLTPRERQILEQLCLGHSLDDIAKALSIRPRTVKFHQENLLRKTGAGSRAELFKKLL
jgi:DNA-binding CsgD family transcriptional regulator